MSNTKFGPHFLNSGFIAVVVMAGMFYACNQVTPPGNPGPVEGPGGGKKVHAHGHAPCKQGTNDSISILINSAGLADPEFEAIIVCAGDTITWVAADASVASFTIDFTTKGNQGHLFKKDNNQQYPDVLNSTVSGSSLPQTPVETVDTPSHGAKRLNDFAYLMTINPSAPGSSPVIIDPHVIPMGN
jgi:hypothetical protein